MDKNKIEFVITDLAVITLKRYLGDTPIIKICITKNTNSLEYEFYDIDIEEYNSDEDILFDSSGVSIVVNKEDLAKLSHVKLGFFYNELNEEIFYFSKF